MVYLTILLTVIQFGILFYLFFKVISITKLLEQQKIEHNQILVLLRKLMETKDSD